MRWIMCIWVSLLSHHVFVYSVRASGSDCDQTKCVCVLCVCVPAEAASLLSRNVSYEGPALRKQLAKAQQLQQELSRREVEGQSSAADLKERYYTACKQYGITVNTGLLRHAD